MGFDVALIATDNSELFRVGFYSIEKARAFAKAGVYGMAVKCVLILSFNEKYEGYKLGDDGKPEWLVF